MKTFRAAFTVVELLVAMAIFTILLAALGSYISTSQRTINIQQARTAALIDARNLAGYLSEQVAQASYIYPKGTILKVKVDTANKDITVGKSALAFLVANEGTPCTESEACLYNGMVFYIDDRSNYSDQLPLDSTGSDKVMVKGETSTAFKWTPDTVPATTLKDWTGYGGLIVGVQGEDVDIADTDLMGSGSSFAGAAFTDSGAFNTGVIKDGQLPTLTQTNALINSLSYKIGIFPKSKNSSSVLIDGGSMARNIPRAN